MPYPWLVFLGDKLITCQKLQQAKSTAYVGYFRGEHAAIQQAVIIAKGPVVLCSLCLNQDDKKP